MIVTAETAGDVSAGASAQYVVLENEDIEQIAWECGRQVQTFLETARAEGKSYLFAVVVRTSFKVGEYGNTSATARE